MTTPDAELPTVPADEAAVRAELDDVRRQVVELWHDGDAATGREMVGSVLGGVAFSVTALLTGILLTNLGEEPPGALAAVAGLDLLLGFATYRCFRSTVRRRVHLYRDVRRLRRRERELAAMLPAGTAGPSSYRRYYADRFGNPALLVLYAAMLVVLLLALLD